MSQINAIDGQMFAPMIIHCRLSLDGFDSVCCCDSNLLSLKFEEDVRLQSNSVGNDASSDIDGESN